MNNNEEILDFDEEEMIDVDDNTPSKRSKIIYTPNGMLERYSDDYTLKTYITNPAIARDEEIKELILILLTPDKSAILVGLPGVGKTAVVEGLSYRIQRGEVPELLKDWSIVKVNTTALIGGTGGTVETRLQSLVDELKVQTNVILFIDEIHTLIGNTEGSLDIANMLKPCLDRGTIKMIGATTYDEYDRYIVRDRAFLRRFERVDCPEPDQETALKIMMGSYPRIEAKTHVKLDYSNFVIELICKFLIDSTSEYKRIYGMSSQYPDICLTHLSKAFSYAMFENSPVVRLKHVYKALINSQNIYPDVIKKQAKIFKEQFKDILEDEGMSIDDLDK